MSINKLISIKEAILEASEDMGFDLTRDKPIFSMWAVRAEKDIGSYYSYKRKRAVLTINHCRAELPCTAAFLKAVILGDHGCDCGELFTRLLGGGLQWTPDGSTLFGADIFLLVDGNFQLCQTRYEVQDNCLVFSSDLNGQKVTIEYLGLEEDCDGFVMINENHNPAIIEYIMWKFCVRSRFSQIKMDLADIQMHQREYNRLVSDARAMDAELTPAERQACVDMLWNPYGGMGLEIGSMSNYGLIW